MKGVVEFEIQGKQRGFRHDNYALLIVTKKEGCSLGELHDRINSQGIDTLTLLHLMYGLAVSFTEFKKKPVDFTVNEMTDWLNEIGGEKISEYIIEVFKTPEPKNSPSPQEAGVTISQ